MINMISYLPDLLHGVLLTAVLMLITLMIGLMLALLMTLGGLTESQLLKRCINALIFFVRGTPLLVQVFLIYYGSGQFSWVRESFIWMFLREPMCCAILALAINSACYTTILLRGAIDSVPHNEIAAAHALGMSKWLAIRRIILPRAARIALPAYSNEVIIILKSTSLASAITLLELMGTTQQLISLTYDTVTFYSIAAALYLVMNAIVVGVFKLFQRQIISAWIAKH